MRLRVEFSPEALTQVEARRAWWQENRDNAGLFDDELADAIAYLAEHAGSLPVVMEIGPRKIRRSLLPKTRCHLYFEVESDRVFVASAWGAIMGKPPPL